MHRPGLAFAGLFAVTFCGLLAVGAVLPVLPRYVHGPLGAGDIAVGVVIGSYAISGLLLRPIAGRLADRRGRKPTVLIGGLLLCISGLLYLPSLGLAGLIVARLVLGAGEGSVYTAGSAWIIDLAPPARRGRVLGLYGLAVWGGLSVGPLAGEVLLQTSGYTAVWIFAAAMPLLGALIAPAGTRPLRAGRPRRAAPPDRSRGGAAGARGRAGLDRLRRRRHLHRPPPRSPRRRPWRPGLRRLRGDDRPHQAGGRGPARPHRRRPGGDRRDARRGGGPGRDRLRPQPPASPWSAGW